MEWWIDIVIILQYIHQHEFQQLHPRCRVQYVLNNAVFTNLRYYFGHFGYHLCQLLILEEKVRLHMAIIVPSKSSPIMRNCLLLANHVNPFISRLMLKLNRQPQFSSNAKLP